MSCTRTLQTVTGDQEGLGRPASTVEWVVPEGRACVWLERHERERGREEAGGARGQKGTGRTMRVAVEMELRRREGDRGRSARGVGAGLPGTGSN